MESQRGNGGTSSVEVQPLSIYTGAEIAGVDLSQPLSNEAVREIRDALLTWKVVFFRGQDIDDAQHVAFARRFGAVTQGHAVYGAAKGLPEIYLVSKEAELDRHGPNRMVTPWSGWHTDITPALNPPAASILRGIVIPDFGGDTQWTNLAAAYEALSETMRGFVDRLRAVHRYAPRAVTKLRPGTGPTLITEHPLVRVHPETGERILFASPAFIASIVGLAPRESQILLEFLWEHIVRPEFTVRFKWNKGDIAFWDNRATAHLAPDDIFHSDVDRQLHRVTLMGDIPVGVDGRPSRAIEGPPIAEVASAA